MNLFFFHPFTGVITTGSAQRYLESYIVSFSKDRKNWRPHKDVLSKEKKVCALTVVVSCYACYASCGKRLSWLLWSPGVPGPHRWPPQGSQQRLPPRGGSLCSAAAAELARSGFRSGPGPGLSRFQGYTQDAVVRQCVSAPPLLLSETAEPTL